MAAATQKPKLLVIVGPTASGKSALAMRIARQFDGEIISADSWQVYKGFDIGTAKASAKERQAVKHYLIDVAEPTTGFNAPTFKRLAETAIAKITAKNKLPIMAGGTGLYIDSVLYDFGFLPVGSQEDRQLLNSKTLDELLALAEAKSISLTGIDKRNKRRVVRAIEAGGQKPQKSALRPVTLMIGLDPMNGLRDRAEKRVKLMLESGLEKEVRGLAARYGWNIEPMKGVGYREWQDYFVGKQTLVQTEQRIVSANMALAKRQRTWMKRDKNIVWFSDSNAAFDYISKLLNK